MSNPTKRKYDEKLVEDALRDYPQDFLGEPLKILDQQPTIDGFRPDLIFKDQRDIPVIVEVQLKALDRSHLYRSLEYRDLYRMKVGAEEVRVILFCNSIPPKYEKVLSTHNVVCRKIEKKEFLKKLISLVPKIKVTSATWEKKISHSLTPAFLLREICKVSTEKNSLFPPNTFAYWVDPQYPRRMTKQNLIYPLIDVKMKDGGFIDPRYFHDGNGPATTIKTRFGPMEVCVPLELFVSWKPFERIDYHLLEALLTLIDLMNYNYRSNYIEISLGEAGIFDPFGWFSYIKGRKKKFEVLIYRYGRTMGEDYDVGKIRDDLEWLLNLKVYIGKYPHFIGEGVFKSYEIVQGPGEQRRKWCEVNRQSLIERRCKEKVIQEFDIRAQQEEKKWVSIRFNDVSESGKGAVKYFLDHVIEHDGKISSPLVSSPKDATEIPVKALKLTSRFFWHLGLPKGEKIGLEEATNSSLNSEESLGSDLSTDI